jgi:hypothetical protein
MNGPQENQKLEFAQNVNLPIGIEKKCAKCLEYKPLLCFYKDKIKIDGLGSYCKICSRERGNKWFKKNKETRKEIYKIYREKNKKKYKEYRDKWVKNNPEKVRALRRKTMAKKRNSVDGKVRVNFSISIVHSLRTTKGGKGWEKLLGYSLIQLKRHLEKQFLPGMTWDNYGRNGWHIDHIIPKSAFNYKSPEDIDFKRCWDLKNLRPLWATDNLKKHSKLIKNFQPSFSFN